MLNLMSLSEGQQIRMRDGSTGEVVENMGDGIWVQVRFLTQAGKSGAVGEEELIHCEEIVGLADPA